MADHYDTAIVPARPKKPKDKAKVEVGVQVATRWVIAKLRKRSFFSLAELNAAIRDCVEQINNRVTRHLGASRRSLFEQVERPTLKSLPATEYVFAYWKQCRAGIDYHVEIDKHYYSVPYTLVREELWASYGRGVPSRQARRCAPARSSQSRAYDLARAHALEPSALCRLDDRAHHARGRRDRL